MDSPLTALHRICRPTCVWPPGKTLESEHVASAHNFSECCSTVITLASSLEFHGSIRRRARGGARPAMIMGLRFLGNTRLRGKSYDLGITLSLSTAELSPQLQLTVAAITIARQTSVLCETGSCVTTTAGELLPGVQLHRRERGKEPS
eukprot:3760899-Pleurochrysis_carterae.AAC.2